MGAFQDRIDHEWELRDAERWDAHERGEHPIPNLDCARCRKVLRETPDPSWTEDAEGFVREPLSFENREGDPAFNGALDKW